MTVFVLLVVVNVMLLTAQMAMNVENNALDVNCGDISQP